MSSSSTRHASRGYDARVLAREVPLALETCRCPWDMLAAVFFGLGPMSINTQDFCTPKANQAAVQKHLAYTPQRAAAYSAIAACAYVQGQGRARRVEQTLAYLGPSFGQIFFTCGVAFCHHGRRKSCGIVPPMLFAPLPARSKLQGMAHHQFARMQLRSSRLWP